MRSTRRRNAINFARSSTDNRISPISLYTSFFPVPPCSPFPFLRAAEKIGRIAENKKKIVQIEPGISFRRNGDPVSCFPRISRKKVNKYIFAKYAHTCRRCLQCTPSGGLVPSRVDGMEKNTPSFLFSLYFCFGTRSAARGEARGARDQEMQLGKFYPRY